MAPKVDPILSLYGRAGAELRWSRTPDRSTATAPARAAFTSKFEAQVRQEFPDLPDDQITRMAEHRRKAFFLDLAARSVASRRRQKAGAS